MQTVLLTKRNLISRHACRSGGLVSIFTLLLFCLTGTSLFAQGQTITGTVKDTDGIELIGASIQQKGTSSGAITDLDGSYSITLVEGAGTLVFSYTGYATQTIEVGNRSVIDVTLTSGAILEEVVVVGYGRQKKSDLTGAVASVKVEDLKGIPTSRVDQILQGRTAGVQITNVNGAPGAGTVIRIRGGNSIEGNNEPLWVIDGIIVGQNYNLNNLNPNDIASIEVLKDASSVAIYGSRGANGVILVTTKLGSKIPGGKPQVSVGLSSGIQSALGRPALLNTPTKMRAFVMLRNLLTTSAASRIRTGSTS